MTNTFLRDAIVGLAIFMRKNEKKRMYELAFKYNHIKKLIMVLRNEPGYFKTKIITSPNIKEMTMVGNDVFITVDERKALLDWMKVISGLNPLYDCFGNMEGE
jgi:hypothetical protein